MTKMDMEMTGSRPANARPGRIKAFMRELHTWIAALSIALAVTIFFIGSLPDSDSALSLAKKFLGPGAPFFAGIGILVLYAFAAFVVDAFGLVAPRRWTGLGNALYWAQESSQWTGLISSFYAFMIGINSYSQNLANGTVARQEFLQSVSLAITSTLAGGVLALVAFTLQRVLPSDEGGA